jgi:hypothetical protein
MLQTCCRQILQTNVADKCFRHVADRCCRQMLQTDVADRCCRHVADRCFRQNQNTHCMFRIFFFENRAIYEIMWKTTVEPGRSHVTIWRMRIACWIPMTAKAHSEYVLLIDFLLQYWLHERALMLHYNSVLPFLLLLYLSRICSTVIFIH